MSVKRLGNKKYEIRGSVPTSTGKYHYYFFRKSFNSINEAREYELKYKESFNIENHTIEKIRQTPKKYPRKAGTPAKMPLEKPRA